MYITTMPRIFRKRPIVRRKAARRPSKSSAKTFAKKVLSVVHSQQENKMAYVSNSGVTLFNSGINSNADAIRIVPNISVGSNDYQRVGDQIRAQSMRLKGYISMGVTSDVANSSNRRIGVRMMVVTPKSWLNVSYAETNGIIWMSGLLKKGATTANFTGAVSDLFADINTDLVTVHYNKVSYFSQPVIYGALAPAAASTVSDIHKTIKFFNVNIKCKNKLIKYDAQIDIGLTPVNFAPILLIGYVHLDNSAVDVLTTQVGCSYEAMLQYEDN